MVLLSFGSITSSVVLCGSRLFCLPSPHPCPLRDQRKRQIQANVSPPVRRRKGQLQGWQTSWLASGKASLLGYSTWTQEEGSSSAICTLAMRGQFPPASVLRNAGKSDVCPPETVIDLELSCPAHALYPYTWEHSVFNYSSKIKVHIFTCVFKSFKLHFTQCCGRPRMRVYTRACARSHTWRLVDNLQKSVLSFYPGGSQDQTLVVRLGNKHPYNEPSHYLQKGAPGIFWKLHKTLQSGSETIRNEQDMGFKATPISLRVSTPLMDKQRSFLLFWVPIKVTKS